MGIQFDNCVVSDVFEGKSKDNGRPFMILTFFEPQTCHEYKVFVPERLHEVMGRVPQRVAVTLFFEVTQGRNQSLAVQLSGWNA